MFKGFSKNKGNNQKSQITYSVQVIRDTFTNTMIKELCSYEFGKLNSSTEEVIIIDSNSAKQILQMDKWPFVLKFDNNCKAIFVTYANETNGVTKIDCFVVDNIDPELVSELSDNNGIIRLTK